jgi:hypothetical protein
MVVVGTLSQKCFFVLIITAVTACPEPVLLRFQGIQSIGHAIFRKKRKLLFRPGMLFDLIDYWIKTAPDVAAKRSAFNGDSMMPISSSSHIQSEAPGQISADSLYTLAEVKQRLKLGNYALRQARRAGLQVRRIGRRAYVLGRDLIQFVESVHR